MEISKAVCTCLRVPLQLIGLRSDEVKGPLAATAAAAAAAAAGAGAGSAASA